LERRVVRNRVRVGVGQRHVRGPLRSLGNLVCLPDVANRGA
jgi:hypothetical protein